MENLQCNGKNTFTVVHNHVASLRSTCLILSPIFVLSLSFSQQHVLSAKTITVQYLVQYDKNTLQMK